MKKSIALLLTLLMLLAALAACADDPADGIEGTDSSTETEAGSESTNNNNDNGGEENNGGAPALVESSLNVNMSPFGESSKLYVATDFGETGKGALESVEGVWETLTDANGTKSLKAGRTDGGSQYQSAKWSFETPYSYGSCDGILFHVDFSAANTSSFHGAVVRLYTELDGFPLVVQPGTEMTAYSSADGNVWVERAVDAADEKEMHVALDNKFVGYVYIPFSQYEGIESFDNITGLSIDVCRVTNGNAVVKDITLVSLENPYENPDLSVPLPPIDSVKPTEPAVTPDMSELVANGEAVKLTDFNNVGAGELKNGTSDDLFNITEDKFIQIERGPDSGDWIQSFDWVFNTAVDLTGMAGILVKVDFSSANTNGTNGGHGVSIGIHTYANGTTTYNSPSLGGYAFNSAKDAWQKMTACARFSELLVVSPAKYTRYDGYVYIPLSAFGENGVKGLDCVTALTVMVGACTSGKAYVEEIILVKGTELVPEEVLPPVVNRDNVGPAQAPSQVTPPVDLDGVVSNGSVHHVTDFDSVGAGQVTNTDGNINVVDKGISVEREGDWYDGFDWIFTKAQDFTGATGLLIKVDFTTANTDSDTGFHGISLSLFTKALGDSGAAKLQPAKGGYLYTEATGLWMTMDVSSIMSDYLDGGKRYAGYIFIPMSSLEGVQGLEHVTGFRLDVGAITSAIAYVEDVYMVKGTVEVKDPIEEWFENSKEEQYYSSLNGVTINAIGDSYFAGNGLNPYYVWPQLLATKYNALLNNYGRNGSTMSNYTTEKNPMCDRYVNMPSGADIILVEGGKNDFNYAVPIGTIDSYDTRTFMGALNTIISGLKASNPNAMIVMVTNWKFNGTNDAGLNYAAYANAMVAVAEAQGVYCINASDPSTVGVDMTDSSFRAQYCMNPNDVSHLNLAGMMYVMPKFEKIIAEYYAEFLEGKGIVKPETKTETVETEWHMGYVGSSTNSGNEGKINSNANYYSYSDVIVIEKAGTVIRFVDMEGNTASAAAYVISFWKQVDGVWVIDDSRTDHIAGGSGSAYTYTTKSDNEAVRLCYRSEQTDSFTPKFAEVTLTVTVTPVE